MILVWAQQRPVLKLQWMGPNKILVNATTPMQEIEQKIAVITGPRGEQGQPGLPGPKGEKGDAAIFDESLPLILDGGNF
jgi:hypothetical protein